MKAFPNNMNYAAAESNLAYSLAPANYLYRGDQAETNIFGDGQNSSLFSCFDIQHHPSAADDLDLLMVEELHKPIWYNYHAMPQTQPLAYHAALETLDRNNMHSLPNMWQSKTIDEIIEEPCLDVCNPALALPPAPAIGTPNPTIPCSSSLMPSGGKGGDTISFEQFLVGYGIERPPPKWPCSSLGNALTTAPIPRSQLRQMQNQNFMLQSHILGFASNAANDGIIQKPKRKQGSNPDEGVDGRLQMPQNQILSSANNAANCGLNPDGRKDDAMNRKRRRMEKNRESAARSRARKLAHELEMEAALKELREENDKLKTMMHEMKAETNKGGRKLKRTVSCPLRM